VSLSWESDWKLYSLLSLEGTGEGNDGRVVDVGVSFLVLNTAAPVPAPVLVLVPVPVPVLVPVPCSLLSDAALLLSEFAALCVIGQAYEGENLDWRLEQNGRICTKKQNLQVAVESLGPCHVPGVLSLDLCLKQCHLIF